MKYYTLSQAIPSAMNPGDFFFFYFKYEKVSIIATKVDVISIYQQMKGTLFVIIRYIYIHGDEHRLQFLMNE